MLNKSIATSAMTIGAMSVVLALSACSKKDDKAATTTASATTTTTSASTTTAPLAASQAISSAPASAAAVTTTASSTTTTVTTPATAEKTANVSSAPTVAANNAAAAAPNLALKADLTQLFKTLNELDRNTQAKQADMAKKMQNAKTPADQQAFFKEVVAQLDLQKATLNKLKFNDPRVAQTRDKMVESITNSRAGTAALIKKPTATPETNPEIAKSMEKAQKSAEEARTMLMQLTQEAGIKPKGADAAPSKK
ncbi:putative lipoprotein [Moraxella osloensis]|nr:putative lipoprotein [Moraxella osloensis]